MFTKEKLESIFQDFPIPALLLAADKGFEILNVNAAYLNTLALTRNELCGYPLLDVFPDQLPEDPQSPIKKVKHCIEQAIALNQPQSSEIFSYWLSDTKGKEKLRHWMLEYIPIVDHHGVVVNVFQLTHEVLKKGTNEVFTVAPDLLYESIFATSQNALFLSDKDGKILAVNEAACIIFNYTVEEMMTLQRNDVLQLDAAMKKLLKRRELGGRARGEVYGICSDGKNFPCEYSSVGFKSPNGEQRYCTEIIDISKWKNAQHQLKHSEENLRAIFDHTVEGFVLVNKELEIIAYNEKAEEVIFQHSNHNSPLAGNLLLDYLPKDRQESFKLITKKVLKGKPIEYEKSYPLPNGENRWFFFAVNPVKELGRVIGLCISGRDITHQKKAEQEVIRREKQFRRMVEFNADAITILAEHGKPTYVSPAAAHIMGYTIEEILQLNIFEMVHPADRKRSNEALQNIHNSPGLPISTAPFRILHKDGSWRWIEATLTNLLHDPEINGIINNFRDVTDRINTQQQLLQAQKAIELSEEKYRKIFNLSPLPKWIYDLNTLQILEVNQEAIHHYGYTKEEFLAMTILDLRPAEDEESVRAVLNTIQEGLEAPHNYWRHLKKNGEVIMVEITGHQIDYNGLHGRMVISRDVTERLNNQLELIRSNERFKQAARASSDAIWDWDIASDTIFLGEGFFTLFGYKEANTTTPERWITEKIHPEDLNRISIKVADVLKGNKGDKWQDEYRFKKADGSFATICNSVVLIRHEGEPLRMIGAIKDITKQKEEEYHLKLMESVITNTTDAVMIMKGWEEGKKPEIIYVNPAFYHMTGYTVQEIKKHGITLLHGPQTDQQQISLLEQAMIGQDNCQIQAIFYRKDQSSYWASLAISPVRDDKGNVKNYIAIERDISERMDYLTAIEEQNVQLKEIAWFQSHIVRAPLARILGLTELLIDEVKDSSSTELLTMLKKSANELDAVIQEILRKTDSLKASQERKN